MQGASIISMAEAPTGLFMNITVERASVSELLINYMYLGQHTMLPTVNAEFAFRF